ncbi:carotenoid oxygenase family protein [Vibrio sp. PP-XX7]
MAKSDFPDVHHPDARELPPFGERWRVNLGSEQDLVEIERFIDHIGEMPVIDARFATQKNSPFLVWYQQSKTWPYAGSGSKGPPFTCLGHFDEQENKLDLYYAGPDSSPEEPCFVPRSPDAEEGDGWLLSIVGRRNETVQIL